MYINLTKLYFIHCEKLAGNSEGFYSNPNPIRHLEFGDLKKNNFAYGVNREFATSAE